MQGKWRCSQCCYVEIGILNHIIWQPIALKYCLDALQRNFPLVLGYSFYIIRPYKNGLTVPNILYLYRLILFEQCAMYENE